MSLQAVTCRGCGGAVVMEVGAEHPQCLFCGARALEQTELPETVEPPKQFLPFAQTEDDADTAFRTFARSSIWYPSDIRQARLELRPLLLPAWLWSGEVEGHYVGLVRAASSSGKRPVSGVGTESLTGVLVPSSTAISRTELSAISPFDASAATAFDVLDATAPFELGTLTRSAATHAAMREMENIIVGQIAAETRTSKVRVSCLYSELEGEPVLLPVYVGTYRRGEKFFRVVINGQSGELTGHAPYSIVKILSAIFGCLGCLGFIFLMLAFLGLIGQAI